MARTRSTILLVVTTLIFALLTTAVPASRAKAQDAQVTTTVLQSDNFTRNVDTGWGEAPVGGAWRLSAPSDASVNGAEALVFVPRAAVRAASLGGSVSGPMAARVSISLPELPGSEDVYTGLTLRRQGGNYYFVRVRVDSRGESFLSILAQLDGSSAWSLTPEERLGRVAGGGWINLVAGSDLDDSLVTAKAWFKGQPQPGDWQVQAYEPDLPNAGEVGLRSVVPAGSPGLEFAYDDYEVLQVGTNQQPIADFVVNADGLNIDVDASPSSDPDGTITKYAWDFGDGSTATGVQPPVKTYAANGTYTVTLTVTDNLGATGTTTQEVAVNRSNANPRASFTTTIDDLAVAMDPADSSDSDGTIAGYLWNFGDGSPTSTERAPTHTYAEPGTYTIELTVTDNDGGQGRQAREVTVTRNAPPAAAFIFTQRELALYVNGGVSTDSDGEIVSYAWDYGDGTTASGVEPPVHTFSQPGDYNVVLTVTDNKGGTNTYSQTIVFASPEGEAAPRGAEIPVIYNLSDLPGTKRFVAPNGSDETGDGSQAKPFRTMQRALDRSAAGDSVVVRGGTYEIAKTGITKNGITLTAYPGETPVFDGSIPAPTSVGTEGSLKFFDYKPMIARPGDGLNISHLPEAKFDSAGKPTGLAAERGWACVASNGQYSRNVVSLDADQIIPYDPPNITRAGGSGCPSGTTPRMIAGYYPDQVWVDGKHLIQVLDKSLVRPGYFYVPRAAGTDANPGPSRMYLSAQDAADMSKVRVSSSNDNFFIVQGDGVTIRGLKIQRHSPPWPFFSMTVTSNTDNVTVEDMEFNYVTSVALKISGNDAANGAGLTDNPTTNRVTITRASWMGTSQDYTNDGTISNSVVTYANYDREFNAAPKGGGVKATKTHGMRIVNSEISNNTGHGIWWDQSNYGATLADSDLRDNSDSALFYEISHDLTMVNNLITRSNAGGGPTVRLAGTSAVKIVNNTIVGGQVPFSLAGDPRSKVYGPNKRLCAEHTERYRQGGSIASDCPPALSSDLDKARAGAFGNPNRTPGMTWMPSASLILNNVFANPVGGSGGICPGGYPVCYKAYSGSAASPNLTIPANQMLPPNVQMNGNVYQSANTAVQMLASNGQPGGFKAATLAEARGNSGFGSSFYGLKVEANGVQGTDLVAPDGRQTADFSSKNEQAVAVPSNAKINEFIPAGTRHYGAIRDTGAGQIPTDLPTASFTASVSGNAVTVDATESSWSGGDIAGYVWSFGDVDEDGEPTPVEFGVQAEHAYSTPGTYTVTLVVIGETGVFNYTQKQIVIADPNEPVIAEDTFQRIQSGGWGTADVGGPWSVSGGAAKYSVDGERGVFDLDRGQSRRALLNDVKAPSADVTFSTGTNTALTGGGVYVSALPRTLPDGTAYRAKLHVKADGTTALSLTRTDANWNETAIKSAPADTRLSGITAAVGVQIRVQAVGSSPTTLRAKAWKLGEPEPDGWQVEATDNTAALQVPGGAGLLAYESSSSTAPLKWFFDNFKVRAPQ